MLDNERIIEDVHITAFFDMSELPLWEAEKWEEMKSLRLILHGRNPVDDRNLPRDLVQGYSSWDLFDTVTSDDGREEANVSCEAGVIDLPWIRRIVGRCHECEDGDTKATCHHCGTCATHCGCRRPEPEKPEWYESAHLKRLTRVSSLPPGGASAPPSPSR
jgi:hypothetical protein